MSFITMSLEIPPLQLGNLTESRSEACHESCLVCGVRKYVMESYNALCLSSKSLTLRKRLVFTSVCCLLCLSNYIEYVVCDPTENRTYAASAHHKSRT